MPDPQASAAPRRVSGKHAGVVFHAFSLGEKIPGVLWAFVLGENLPRMSRTRNSEMEGRKGATVLG